MKRFRQFLNEGGHTFQGSSRINQENVEATLTHLYKAILPVLKLRKSNVAVIGTTGKKGPGESSGDIDITVDATIILKKHKVSTVAELFALLTKIIGKLASVTNETIGLGVFNFLWPIANTDGKQEGELVQVDLMLSDNIEFSKWGYFSPYWHDTKYKGAVRNALLIAAVKFAYQDIKKRDENGNPTEWEKYIIDWNKGLFKALQTNIGKSGKIVKKKTLLKKEFISADVDKVIHLVLGPNASQLDTVSFETLIAFIKGNRFGFPKLRKTILDFFKQDMLDKGWIIPDELN